MAFLGLGSNLGRPIDELSKAIVSLRDIDSQLRISSLYLTKARDFVDQAHFYNCVVALVTDVSPLDLLELCQKLERDAHRLRLIDKGPRSLDIDILLYDSLVLKSGGSLIIPHPRMNERRFVLEPLVELEPELIDPKTTIPFKHYLDRVKDQIIYQSYEPAYNGDCLWQIP